MGSNCLSFSTPAAVVMNIQQSRPLLFLVFPVEYHHQLWFCLPRKQPSRRMGQWQLWWLQKSIVKLLCRMPECKGSCNNKVEMLMQEKSNDDIDTPLIWLDNVSSTLPLQNSQDVTLKTYYIIFSLLFVHVNTFII